MGTWSRDSAGTVSVLQMYNKFITSETALGGGVTAHTHVVTYVLLSGSEVWG